MQQFHREVAERFARTGQLALLTIQVDGETVATAYGCRFGKRTHQFFVGHSYNERWKRYGLGEAMYLHMIRHAIDAAARCWKTAGASSRTSCCWGADWMASGRWWWFTRVWRAAAVLGGAAAGVCRACRLQPDLDGHGLPASADPLGEPAFLRTVCRFAERVSYGAVPAVRRAKGDGKKVPAAQAGGCCWQQRSGGQVPAMDVTNIETCYTQPGAILGRGKHEAGASCVLHV